MPDPQNPALPPFKGQPWILFDTVVSKSLLVNDTRNGMQAIGTMQPAISGTGDMIFFNAPGRNSATTPWYTNLDQQSQLSFGLEVWAIYMLVFTPTLLQSQSSDPVNITTIFGIPPNIKILEVLLHFAELELELGQENQMKFPASRFGAGGGLWTSGGAEGAMQGTNGIPIDSHVLKLPEPIQMPRTQNLAGKLRISPEGQAMLGNAAALPGSAGVGMPQGDYQFVVPSGETTQTNSLPQLPFMVQLGLVGRRIKSTQYGQLAG